jgi:hypothetical protein
MTSLETADVDGTLDRGRCAMTEGNCGNYYYLFDYYCYCCKCDLND